MTDAILLGIGFFVLAVGLAGWAIGLYRYWGEREPYRGVKAGQGHLPASHSYSTSQGPRLPARPPRSPAHLSRNNNAPAAQTRPGARDKERHDRLQRHHRTR